MAGIWRHFHGSCHVRPQPRRLQQPMSQVAPPWPESILSRCVIAPFLAAIVTITVRLIFNREWLACSNLSENFVKKHPMLTTKMSVRSHVYNGTWQDGVDCVKPTKQPFREPKWPVQISSLLQIPVMRCARKKITVPV